MKHLALLFYFFSTVISTYVFASEAALMHFDQQLKALTATIRAPAHGSASVESKIKELSQLLVDLQRERKGRGARMLYDDFQKTAQKRFVSLFNELLDTTLGKGLELSRGQKEQLIKVTDDFEIRWPSGPKPLTFQKLLVAWDGQRQARQKRTTVAGASTTIAQTFRKLAENVETGVQQGLQTLQDLKQKAKEKPAVAQVQRQAQAPRPVVAQSEAKKEEEEKKVAAQPVTSIVPAASSEKAETSVLSDLLSQGEKVVEYVKEKVLPPPPFVGVREVAVAQVQQQAEAPRPVVVQPEAKKEEEEKKREQVVAQPTPQARKQEATEQEKKAKEVQQEEEKKVAAQSISIIAQPVVVDPEVAKQLAALEALLKAYKSDLDRALKASASQQDKIKLFQQLKSSFLVQRKALKEYEKNQGHALAPEQEKQLKEIIKNYDEEVKIFVSANQ